jgi:hypothetical protein
VLACLGGVAHRRAEQAIFEHDAERIVALRRIELRPPAPARR